MSDGSYFIEPWFKRLNMRTYERLDSLPPPTIVPHYIYNTFDCFTIDNSFKTQCDVGIQCDSVNTECKTDYNKNNDSIVDSTLEPILNHIDLLVNHDNASYEYVFNYFAHLVQKPGELPGVALH